MSDKCRFGYGSVIDKPEGFDSINASEQRKVLKALESQYGLCGLCIMRGGTEECWLSENGLNVNGEMRKEVKR